MVQLDLTHLASIALGALLGVVALWAYRRALGAARASADVEIALRAKLKLATEIVSERSRTKSPPAEASPAAS